MILLDNADTGFVDFFAGAKTADVVIPAAPTTHKVMIRVVMTLNNQALRTFTVKAFLSGTDKIYTDFDIAVDTTAISSGQDSFFLIGPMILPAVTVRVSVSSDNSGDTNEKMEAFLYSDDPEYYQTYRAAEASPTANSLTERTKAIDDKLEGITSMKQWLGAMAGAQDEDSTAQSEIRDSGEGGGAFAAGTHSQEAIRNRGDAAWAIAAIPTAIQNADALLTREMVNVDNATEDSYTLYSIIMASLNSSIAGATWTIKQTDGTTHQVKTVTSSASADPITGVTG